MKFALVYHHRWAQDKEKSGEPRKLPVFSWFRAYSDETCWKVGIMAVLNAFTLDLKLASYQDVFAIGIDRGCPFIEVAIHTEAYIFYPFGAPDEDKGQHYPGRC
jgi:hypothetical protein